MHTFESPNGAYVHTNTINRFSALSGNGRYTYWKTTLDAMPGHWLDGFGVGTFQIVWLPRAPFPTYIINAHSLFVETLVEVGIVGLLLLAAFLLAVIVGGARAIRTPDDGARTLAAAATAACCAFVSRPRLTGPGRCPVVPVAFLLLAAALLAPATPAPAAAGRAGASVPPHVGQPHLGPPTDRRAAGGPRGRGRRRPWLPRPDRHADGDDRGCAAQPGRRRRRSLERRAVGGPDRDQCRARRGDSRTSRPRSCSSSADQLGSGPPLRQRRRCRTTRTTGRRG